jgi:uncharacterized protein YndB with AHSA1/START domain
VSEATGAQVEVVLVANQEPKAVWDLITDVARIGEWSPECVGGRWLDGAGPRPGARFEGDNRFAHGFTSTVTCVVTQAQRPAVFEWIVLDPSESVHSPGSIWRYELTPGDRPGQTTVLHRFVHGAGETGLSRAMRDNPDQAGEILRERLDILREHMTVTLTAMTRDPAAGSDHAE